MCILNLSNFNILRKLSSMFFKFLILIIYGSIPIYAFKCGLDTCNPTDPGKLNVHLIPHTHDDVGWLKTVDQYYYGANKGYSFAGVQYILDSVISELQKNPSRRFIYVEMAFFWRYWEELSEEDKSIVKNLVEEGRLEFVHGGWCMSDEASPHYTMMIDQMTLGLKFLNETFGECGHPTVSWQIDPFGHSSEVALEFASMGYDSLFVARIDYEDHHARKLSKEMEVIWRPDTSIEENGGLFFNMMYNHYAAPKGFCFDADCSDDPIVDNKKLHGYNVNRRIVEFEKHVRQYSSGYKTNHILIPMGDDFSYTSASAWFKNIDKLIKYTNSKYPSLNLLYSTPACYVNALNSINTTWPTKDDDDFFPYGSDAHSYWTGYFTSRPALKYMVYRANNILQAVKQISTTQGLNRLEEEFAFKRSVAIAQHHDAVSGTEKQHVADDYAQYLQEGLNFGQEIANDVFKSCYGETSPKIWLGSLRNISQCEETEGTQNFVVVVYNPLSRSASTSVRFPVARNVSYKIFHQSGSPIDFEIIPIAPAITKLPGRNSTAVHDLLFTATNLPPLGVTNYYVQVTSVSQNEYNVILRSNQDSDIIVVDNGLVQLTFNGSSGLLRSIKKDGIVWSFHQNFYFYEPMRKYDKSGRTRASGAYIFRPTQVKPRPIAEIANLTIFEGTHVKEVHQTFSPWLSQIVRLYNGSDNVEFEWLVGPIPIINDNGMEIVSRYTTDLPSNSTFYTDSNGRRWVKRVRNYRKYWNLTMTEPVSCNYYPLTTGISLKSSDRQLTIITDRPEGGSSLTDGQLEIMVHRRLRYDDEKGVGEPLDEIAFGTGLVVRGKHIVQLNNLTHAAEAYRLKSIETAYGPLSLVGKTTLELKEWLDKFNKNISLLNHDLPANVQITTFERWHSSEQILIRLEHIFEANESCSYSKPVTVDLKNLFNFIEVNDYEELILSANIPKKNVSRLKWNVQGNCSKRENNSDSEDQIILKPMQIRTFLLHLVRK